MKWNKHQVMGLMRKYQLSRKDVLDCIDTINPDISLSKLDNDKYFEYYNLNVFDTHYPYHFFGDITLNEKEFEK